MKTFLSSMLFLVTIITIQAQTTTYCWNDVKTITTKWDEANTSNFWNWTDNEPDQADPHDKRNKIYAKTNTSYTIGTVTYLNSVKVDLPYFCTGAIGQGGCSNPNTSHWHQLALQDLPIHPEDGWELVVKNFGCEDVSPGAPCPLTKGVDYAHFVLYNRFNGKLLVFFLFPSQQTANGAEIHYSFAGSGYKSAIFSHALPATKPLVTFDPQLLFRVPNYYYNQQFFWVYAEIPTYYDPCVCLDPRANQSTGTPSRILIQLKVDLTTTVDLAVEGQITQSIIDPNVAGRVPLNQSQDKVKNDPIAIYKATLAGMKAGSEAYKTFDFFSSKFVSYFDGLNADYKKKVAKDFWEMNNPYLDNSLQPDWIKEQQFNLFLSSPDGFKKSLGLETSNPTISALKNMASYFPYVGGALGLIDHFINGGKSDKSKPVSPPQSFNVNMTIRGTEIISSYAGDLSFNTPGGSVNQNEYTPFYNNTLGVFGVLKSPGLKYYEFSPNETGNFVHIGGETETIYRNSNDPPNKIRQYLLADQLKYLLNHHANVEVLSIDAALVLEYDYNMMQQHRYFSSQCLNSSDPKCAMTSKYRCYLPVINKDFGQLQGLSLDDKVLTSGMELDYIETDFQLGLNKTMRIRTPYVPIDCLHNLSFYLHVPNSAIEQECAPKVMVKMYVKMRPKNNPNAEPVTEIILVELPEAISQSSILAGSEDLKYDWELVNGSSSVGFLYQNVLNINNTHPNPFFNYPKNATFKAGDVISSDVYAWHSVKLLNGVTVNPGVKIRAGQKVFVDNYNDLPPTTDIEIIGYFESGCPAEGIGHEHYKATDSEIETVCTSNSYKQKATAANPEEPADDEESEVLEIKKPFQFDIYPNPAYSEYNLEFSLAKDAKVHFEIYDLSGQLVEQPMQPNPLDKGNYKLRTSAENLKAGIYILRFYKDSEVFNQKLVVVK